MAKTKKQRNELMASAQLIEGKLIADAQAHRQSTVTRESMMIADAAVRDGKLLASAQATEKKLLADAKARKHSLAQMKANSERLQTSLPIREKVSTLRQN